MSIERPRPAAGQWTAANVRDDALDLGGLRGKRLASWLLIVPTLAVFSLSLVAGARALRKPDYAAAVKQLPQNQPLIVVAGAQKSVDNFFGWFSDKYTSKELCAVTQAQLAQLAQHYTVGHMTVQVDGKPVDVVTLDGKGANDHDLRTYLGDPNMKCKLVRNAGTFFLPFDSNQSE
jgi:hypothetical protein